MNLFIFDLDGTLVDTKKNIALAINFAMRAIDLEEIPLPIISSFVGDGSKRLLERCFTHHNISDSNLYSKAWNIFYEYYYDNVEQCTQLYPEVENVLKRLENHHLAVLTNKPQKMANKLLKYLQIDGYFCEIIGGEAPEKLKPNPENLLHLIEKYPADKSIMVGDSKVDIQVAKNANIPCIALTYGFGKREELEEANFIIDSFNEVHKVITENFRN
ncbi:HAD family hydrolase [Candidatus Uabimicrobium sp. HlEnr_7]|uniref:HAD family hydrolase n=1 Tax=Candidatus Uabimicrobium helgolandensis TaxID=3095367 RepID=UPI00355793F4